jgi:hypothetical protein
MKILHILIGVIITLIFTSWILPTKIAIKKQIIYNNQTYKITNIDSGACKDYGILMLYVRKM